MNFPSHPKALLLATIAAGHLTLFANAAPTAEDTRAVIALSPDERALVLAEMRAFLQSVQVITQSLSADDLALAATAGRRDGKLASPRQQKCPTP